MNFLIILAVSLLCCSVGFRMYIYFFSLGYGLAIAGIALALLLMYGGTAGVGGIVACVLLLAYGLRLAGYLFIREARSSAYRKVLSPEMQRSARIPMAAKAGLWAVCGILYFLMTSPLTFRLANGTPDDPALWIGIVVMAGGIVMEAVADAQKSIAKKKNPYRFVSSGLYSIVRCPNYLGELLLWLGMLMSGVTALRGPVQWICAIVGFLLISWVMFSGARRLEIRQDKNYGKDRAYRTYCRRVPIILPFVPLYSVKKYKFLVA